MALAYAREIDDFDDLVDPRHLYECYLGPEPSKYILEKIIMKRKVSPSIPHLVFLNFVHCLIRDNLLFPSSSSSSFFFLFFFIEMTSRYNKDKYAYIRDLKNEPLVKLTSNSKKRKLSEEKADAANLPLVNVAPSSPTPSLEVTVATPPLTRSKGKSKIGMSLWDDHTIALGHVHNVITNDELKGLSSIPSHELVSRHIHKLVQVSNSVPSTLLLEFVLYMRITSSFPVCSNQVLKESLCITTDYLNVEEKVVVATSKVESMKAKCSQLKDLITVMNEKNDAKKKIKELVEALHMEKALVVQKDEKIQATLLKTDEERDKIVQKFKQSKEFSDLQFM